MVVNEEKECVVCFEPYSRKERIPRILHCQHTLCTQCLETIKIAQNGMNTLCCPMCRWITCSRASLGIVGTLYINTSIWDTIPENHKEEIQKSEGEKEDWTAQKHSKENMMCSARKSGLKFILQTFLRAFCLMRCWNIDAATQNTSLGYL